ncbi:uncharacterized protein MYCFIDRAFT_192891 [Pseudocercospora fijiensis CIRAD86]|uniref:Uncharacterized protein n=1 Tax=Pseudocercospora fijiensis (strain CIRAD86) TaxID=383855 RepID=N1Q7T5_PSEFD|nr:uncharacterized protein MYCFIDRAFT_192891 [Pseudocercospora fijiensis CIRAD86]EME88819.1 hypothetical protein MYCFIDRAFT_192891 [Pseudocercospora fijiensis CIRAD86]
MVSRTEDVNIRMTRALNMSGDVWNYITLYSTINSLGKKNTAVRKAPGPEEESISIPGSILWLVATRSLEEKVNYVASKGKRVFMDRARNSEQHRMYESLAETFPDYTIGYEQRLYEFAAKTN